MSKELVISSNRHETKVAVLEDDQLVELFFQRANEYSLAGSIHKGRVTRVLPGMQSAFVDLGLERDCFLYVTDFFEENEDLDGLDDAKPTATAAAAPSSFDRGGGGDRGGGDRGGRDNRGGGGRDRGGRDRGRDRGRDGRDREGGERRPPIAAVTDAAATVGTEPAVERVVIASEGQAPEGIAAPVVSQQESHQNAGQQSNDPRRRRRGRRGRGGFPDSKYASATEAGTDEPGETVAEEVNIVETVAAEPLATFAPPPSAEEVFLLPGESLRKYRNPNPAQAAPPAAAAPAPERFREKRAVETFREVRAMHPEPRQTPPPLPTSGPPPLPTFSSVPPPLPTFATEPVAETHAAAAHLSFKEASSIPKPELDPLSAAEPLFEKTSELTHPEIQVIEENRMEAAEEAAYAAIERESELTPTAAEGSYEARSVVEAIEDADEQEAHLGHNDASETSGEDDGEDAEGFASVTGEEGANPADGPQTAAVRDQDRNARFQSRGRRGRRGRSRNDRPDRAPRTEGDGSAAPVIVEGAEGQGAAAAPEIDRPERSGDRPDRSGDRPEREQRPDRGDRRQNRPPVPSITELLKPGQEILVQVAKEPIGQKGARITSHIALPGRYCVFMPTVEHMGVSRKIASDEERLRLKHILKAHRQNLSGGFIIRTAGEGKTEEDIAADMTFLHNLWMDIKAKAERRPAPVLVHHDLDIVQRILRDQLTTTFKNVWLDNEELYESTVHFVERFQPGLVNRVRLYTRPAPIFDSFGVTAELEKALRPKVWLKSGGYIVINQTEALVAIDINTGKFVGKSNRLEDTIVKTNTEAVKEIVRQMRLRDLGGIIVVDFIDMDERKNRAKVMQALEDAMRSDRAPYKILQFNDFGLVAITRKRVKQSLERTLCAPCPYCEGAGYVKSVQTVIGEILTEAMKMAKVFDGKDVILRVNPEVAKVLKSTETHYLEELEGILGKPVMVKGDATVHQEKFDMAS